MPSWNSAAGNCIILTRPSTTFEKVGVMLAKTLEGVTFSLRAHTLPLVAKKLWRKNLIFIGSLTEPSMRRVLCASLLARKTVLYCVVEGPPLLYWLKPLLKALSKNIFQVVTPSNFVREELEMIGIKVSAVIPHAVDLDEMEKLSVCAQKVETSWSNRISEAKTQGKSVFTECYFVNECARIPQKGSLPLSECPQAVKEIRRQLLDRDEDQRKTNEYSIPVA